MRLVHGAAFAVALATLVPPAIGAAGQDASRSVGDGGISVPGWTGKVDPNEEKNGQTVKDARLSGTPDALSVTTGPSISYWNPANTASGDYTVKATFTEPKFRNLNNHPHPYGIFIGGSDMGTATQSYLYCAAYGSGSFIVRGFGPAPFQMNGRRGEAHEAVNKAADVGEPVTQEIAMSVRGDTVECAINGTVVATYDKSAVVGEGKLKSTDGVYGIRFGHNTEGTVKGLTVTKH